MGRNPSLKIIFFVFILLMAVYPSYGFGIKREKPLPKKWAKVTRGDIRQTIITTGVVRPEEGAEIKVGSRVSGKVEKLYVKVGDKVKRGDLIAVIEHKDLKVKVEEKKASLREVKQELEALKAQRPLEISRLEEEIQEVSAQLSQAEATYRRYRELLPEKLVSQEDVDLKHKEVLVYRSRLAAKKKQLMFTRQKYRDDLRITETRLKRAETAYRLALINYDYAFIRSPIDGTIEKISTPEGETVAAQLSSPTFVWIIDLKRLWVTVYVDETDIGKVVKGQQVFFHVDAYPGVTFHGKVDTIYPKAETRDNMVTYQVIVRISDPLERRTLLRPEMTAYTTIVVKEKKNVLVVPVQAVKIVEGKSVVIVKKGQGNERREVVTGWTDRGKVEIREGLGKGEEVLIQGFTREILQP